jgi:hypothetical protein
MKDILFGWGWRSKWKHRHPLRPKSDEGRAAMPVEARLGVRAQTNKLPLPHFTALNLLYAAPPVKERDT